MDRGPRHLHQWPHRQVYPNRPKCQWVHPLKCQYREIRHLLPPARRKHPYNSKLTELASGKTAIEMAYRGVQYFLGERQGCANTVYKNDLRDVLARNLTSKATLQGIDRCERTSERTNGEVLYCSTYRRTARYRGGGDCEVKSRSGKIEDDSIRS